MGTPYVPSLTTCACVAFPDQPLPRLRCHCVSAVIGSGSHTRDVPFAKESSTLVSTSYVRHSPAASAPRHGTEAAAETAIPDFRNALRSIGDSDLGGLGTAGCCRKGGTYAMGRKKIVPSAPIVVASSLA